MGRILEEDLIVKDRDFDAGRKGFIYVAGNLGNVQKGLDLLLDTFARTPELTLYIYCNVEDEVRTLFLAAHRAGDNCLEIHAHLFEKVLGQVAAMEAHGLVGSSP